MLKIHRTDGTSMKNWKMSQLSKVPIADAGQRERELQQLIYNYWQAFTDEIGEKLFLVGQEVEPSNNVKDKIDLLAFDPEGRAVILELKRGSNKWQLSQGLCYAAMVAEWNVDRVKEIVEKHGRSIDDLRKHVDGDLESLNPEKRIILIAESFDYEVLITARWLMERHAVRINCWQITLAQDSSGSGDYYLHCVQILPPKELEDLAIQRGRQRIAEAGQVRTIEQLLENCRNQDEKAFFAKRLDQRRNTNRDALAIAPSGAIRWYVEPKAERASVYQVGRFSGDQNTWTHRLSDPQLSTQKRGGLRFYLTTASDFENFVQFVETDGKDLTWTKDSEPDEGTASDPGETSV